MIYDLSYCHLHINLYHKNRYKYYYLYFHIIFIKKRTEVFFKVPEIQTVFFFFLHINEWNLKIQFKNTRLKKNMIQNEKCCKKKKTKKTSKTNKKDVFCNIVMMLRCIQPLLLIRGSILIVALILPFLLNWTE